MKNKKKTKPYIFQISTKPDTSSYKWIGQEISLLSTAILWIIWFFRLLSVYQHLKGLRRVIRRYRSEKGKRAGHRVTNASGRPDIPPMFGEIYFLIWTAFFVLMHVFEWSGTIFRVLAIYYLFETTVWIFYYTVFRRFFEIGYSIYHKLEYLTQIILIIPTQALCYAYIYDSTFREILPGLLGANSDDTPFSVAVLGCLFSAIVISLIISTFPMEVIKKTDTNPNMHVIGCGDVVQKRLYPALISTMASDKVKVYDLDSAENKVKYCTYLENGNAICNTVRKTATRRDVIWIETPSHTHIPYLKALLDSRAKMIVLEKPVSIYPHELDDLRDNILSDPEARERIFFLSYYILEKALPLCYLATWNRQYRKYLDIDEEGLVNQWDKLIGELTSTRVHVCEGEDVRGWVSTEEYGGHLLETFLHNVLVASLFCGKPQNWTDVSFKEELNSENEKTIALTARHKNAGIDLYMKKNASSEHLCRYAEFIFTKGRLYMDLETQRLKVIFNELDVQATVSVKKEFDLRYSVLTDMVSHVAAGGCTSDQIDGLGEQIPVISWLLDLKEGKCDQCEK